jgi:hypothetical protein
MKNQANGLFTISRRRFTRIGSGVLFSLPFLSACSKIQQKEEQSSQASSSPMPAEACGFSTKLAPGIEEHIPPMGLTDGSLDIAAYDALEENQISANKWQYELGSFGNINKVMVMVTNEKDLYTQYYSLIGKPICEPQNIVIKLWLQELVGSDYKPVNTSLPPEVVISSPGKLHMEINERLAKKRTKHPYRPWKYEHEGNGYAKHFRIGVLDISSTNCPGTAGLAHWVTRDLDHYQIWIFGPDIDPH